MEMEAIPRDRIMRRAERIMRHQRQRDATYTVVLTWASLSVAGLTLGVALLLAINVLQPGPGSVLLALLSSTPGVITAWVRTVLRTND